MGEIDSIGKKLKKFYSNIEQDLRRDLEMLPKTVAYKILEIQRCPKCKKEFTEYPALYRNDNKTEICPECDVKEGTLIGAPRATPARGSIRRLYRT